MPRSLFLAALLVAGSFCLSAAHSQPARKAAPRLEPVAETKLLMEGIADPNARALGRLLAEKPKEAEAWAFVRGQSLLLAEMGNLLLMRPPRTKAGEETWLAQSAELRMSAAALARAASAKDYLQARASLVDVANTCNRCHQRFGVKAWVVPFAG